MPDVKFDRYYRYDALSTILQGFADEYPGLVKLQSLGKSHELRDIWLVTVTNFASGPDHEKPALWADGNIHASEVSPSSACLYLIHKLVTAYETDDEIEYLLNTRAFYICPRVNPDGAELALADKPRIIRSSTRPYPYNDEPLAGLQWEDIDGDGRMLQMRVPDPNGPWKKHPDDPRLMVRRDPTEREGEFYRILPEGTLLNFDGYTIQARPIKEGLDLNRNFPAEWRQEHEQSGAGSFPGSEPETYAIMRFIADHKNITGGISFHTFSGVLLRPFSGKPDDKFPAEDLWTYQKIGQKGTDLTGYPNVSVYHDFLYHPNEYTYGDFDGWLYEHVGVFGWTVEIWSARQQAGLKDYKFIDWYREHDIEDDLKLLKWNDEVMEGKAYIDWYSFEHPQLGEVELGGWDMLYAWRNPPPHLLEKEIAPLADWAIWHLQISPRLELLDVALYRLGNDHFQVRLVVQNTGWLPTYVTKHAAKTKRTRGVIYEIELPEGAVLKSGQAREMLGELEGRAYTPSTLTPWTGGYTSDRTKFEWVVYAPQGGEATLTAHHDRAGYVRTTITLA
jgi:murein tripeptide amidase MpaA